MSSPATMERAFPKSNDSLEAIFDFVSEFTSMRGINDDVTREMQFVVEEVFTNMVRYNKESCNDVSIRLHLENGALSVSLADRDVHDYNPNQRPPIDVEQPLQERKPGGLGIHLVREMMDDVQYEYKDRTARITLIKHLENT